jgi:hypothetical protein
MISSETPEDALSTASLECYHPSGCILIHSAQQSDPSKSQVYPFFHLVVVDLLLLSLRPCSSHRLQDSLPLSFQLEIARSNIQSRSNGV